MNTCSLLYQIIVVTLKNLHSQIVPFYCAMHVLMVKVEEEMVYVHTSIDLDVLSL